jgi:hypothetical protein
LTQYSYEFEHNSERNEIRIINNSDYSNDKKFFLIVGIIIVVLGISFPLIKYFQEPEFMVLFLIGSGMLFIPIIIIGLALIAIGIFEEKVKTFLQPEFIKRKEWKEIVFTPEMLKIYPRNNDIPLEYTLNEFSEYFSRIERERKRTSIKVELELYLIKKDQKSFKLDLFHSESPNEVKQLNELLKSTMEKEYGLEVSKEVPKTRLTRLIVVGVYFLIGIGLFSA